MKNRYLLIIAIVLIIIFSCLFSLALQGENPIRDIIDIRSDSTQEVNESKIIISHKYEVTDIYRMYDGHHLIYGVDYIDNDKIKTLVAPDYSESESTFNQLTVHPSNSTYLIYLEEVQDPNVAIITVSRSIKTYELYKSDDFVIQGVPTSYTRVRQSDLHSTVIVT